MEESPCSTIISHVMMPHDANPAGNIHGGAVMKQIDNAAGVVAIRHARTNVVTASIDRLDFHHPVFIGNLLILKASLNWVGKSSMEIGVRAETEDLMTGSVRHVVSAYLTFVSLDARGRPIQAPPYTPGTPEQNRRYQEALRRREMRLAERNKEKNGQSDSVKCC